MGASKQAMMDEVDRIGREEYDEDGNPKTTGYEDLDDHALSLGETIEDFHLIQQSIEDDEIKTGENQ
tara:strand:+ start:289 stop:489 length:201 start_codon:yes stop_codon:yes gene_type:complete